MPNAIGMFLRQVVLQHGMPFNLKLLQIYIDRSAKKHSLLKPCLSEITYSETNLGESGSTLCTSKELSPTLHHSR